MLSVEKVKISFRRHVVIKDATFYAKQGDIIQISGKNGSGKSVLFKAICGLIKYTKGSVKIGAKDVIGALIENPGFIEFETLYNNLKFLANLNGKFDIKYIERLCNIFSLDLYGKQLMNKYSIGMKEKAGIIQAIMEHQNIILLDEPTRGLDSDAVVEFCKLVNELAQDNKTIIIASHDIYSEINYTKKLMLVDGILMDDKR